MLIVLGGLPAPAKYHCAKLGNSDEGDLPARGLHRTGNQILRNSSGRNRRRTNGIRGGTDILIQVAERQSGGNAVTSATDILDAPYCTSLSSTALLLRIQKRKIAALWR